MTALIEYDQVAMTGEIIMLASRIESQLHRISSADVVGIHPLTEMAGDKLSGDIKRKLHYIATIRNQAAHENDFSLSPEDFNRFQTAAGEVLRVLDSLTPEISEEVTDDTPICDVEVEKELFNSLAKKIRSLRYFPAAGIIYLVYLFCFALLKNWIIMLLSTLYICSILLTVKGGIIDGDRGLFYAGGGSFIFVYITTAVMAFRKVVFPKINKGIWLLPVLNIFYLLLRWVTELEWSKFLLSLSGICCFAGSIILLCHSLTGWFFAALAASWIIGIICGAIWGKKREE